MPLRPPQVAAVASTIASLNEHKSSFCCMATGMGKTCVKSNVIMHYLTKGRVMVVANSSELVFQLAREIARWTGEDVDIEKAEWKSNEKSLLSRKKIVVCSMQSLIAGARGDYPGRMSRFDPQDFSLLTIDEADLSLANSFLKLIHYMRKGNPEIHVAGYSATVDRGDKKSMGLVYNHLAFNYSLRDGQRDGWLVPIRQSIVRLDAVDLSAVKVRCGDLANDQLSLVMSAPEAVKKVAAVVLEKYKGRHSLVFSAGIPHGKAITDVLNALKPGIAQHISSEDAEPAREIIYKAYKSGESPILVNHGICGRGWDFPPTAYIANARPTRARSRYSQMVGRGTRPCVENLDSHADANARRHAIADSPKPFCEITDFTGRATDHKLVCAIDLVADTDAMKPEEREEIMHLLETGECINIYRAVNEGREAFDRKVQEEKEAAEQAKFERFRTTKFTAQLEMGVRFTEQEVDPFNPFSVLGKKPQKAPPWDSGGKPTQADLEFLRKYKVSEGQISQLTRWQATRLVLDIKKRWRAGLCTMGQANFLAKQGYDPSKMTFDEASELISRITGRESLKKKEKSSPGAPGEQI